MYCNNNVTLAAKVYNMVGNLIIIRISIVKRVFGVVGICVSSIIQILHAHVKNECLPAYRSNYNSIVLSSRLVYSLISEMANCIIKFEIKQFSKV